MKNSRILALHLNGGVKERIRRYMSVVWPCIGDTRLLITSTKEVVFCLGLLICCKLDYSRVVDEFVDEFS